nr:ABC transporter ATP-binding protein [Levilactobacillus spicheri]
MGLESLVSLIQASAAVILTFETNAVIHRNLGQFTGWIVVDLGMWLILVGADYVANILIARNTQLVDTDIRRDLSTGIANLTSDEFAKRTPDVYVSWLNNDLTLINSQGMQVFFQLIECVALVIMTTSYLVIFHWTLLVTAAIGFLAITFVPRLATRRLTQQSRHVTKANERFVTQVQNTLAGFATLTSFHRRSQIITRNVRASQKLQRANVAYARQKATVDVLSTTVSIVSQMAITVVTALLVITGHLTAGTIMSTGSLAGELFSALQVMSSSWVELKSVQPIFDKYKVLKRASTFMGDRPFAATARPELELDHVMVRHAQQTWLATTTLRVPFWSKVRVSGPSGSGKSTLMRVVTGNQAITAGQVRWRPVPDSPDGAGNSYVAYVPQKAFIFQGTVRDNLTLGRQLPDTALLRALTVVGLAHKIDQLPQRLETVIAESDARLSGGEQQRLALARVLLTDAPVIILDESTANVDAVTANRIERYFLTQPNRTVWIVSHAHHPEVDQFYTLSVNLGMSTQTQVS